MIIYDLRACERGRPALIVCTGPSLHKTDPRRFDTSGFATFSMNCSWLLDGWRPDYWVAEDVHVIQENHAQIDAYDPKVKLLPYTTLHWFSHPEWYVPFYLDDRRKEPPFSFSRVAAQRIVFGGTVTYTALQLAYYMGCDPVYLLGLDHRYAPPVNGWRKGGGPVEWAHGSDPNHFDGRYFAAGARQHPPRLDRMAEAFRTARTAYEADGRRIINLTPCTAETVFEKGDWKAVLREGQNESGRYVSARGAERNRTG